MRVGMHYCYEGGGHVVWGRLHQIVTALIPLPDGRTQRVVELVCSRHLAALPRAEGSAHNTKGETE